MIIDRMNELFNRVWNERRVTLLHRGEAGLQGTKVRKADATSLLEG